MSLWGYMHMIAAVSRGQERALNPLVIELQVVVSFLLWVLGTYIYSSVKAIHALNC